MGRPAPVETSNRIYDDKIPAPAISTIGNDASGIGVEQRNGSHNINITFTPQCTDDLNTSTMKKISRDCGIFEGMLDLLNVSTSAANAAASVEQNALYSLPGLRNPYHQSQSRHTVAAESQKRTGAIGSYTRSAAFSASDFLENEERTSQICLIRGFLVEIMDPPYLESYKNESQLKSIWEKIAHERMTLEHFFRDSKISEAIKNQGPANFTRILEATVESIRSVQYLLVRSTESRQKKQSKSEKGTPIRTSPRRQAKKTSHASQTPASPIRRKSTPHARSPNDVKGLTFNMTDLYTKIRELSSECESILQRATALAEYRYAHDAYKMLYFLLYDHCRRHEAHVIDFDLAQTRQTDTMSIEVHFRFANSATGTPHETSEMWLAFKATGQFLQIGNSFARHELGCLLGYGTNSLKGESFHRLPHSHNGAELNCVRFGSQPQAGVTLTMMNTVLQTKYLVSEGEILHLAKRIATAVIQLNCTPWFTTFWSSDNIVLFPDHRKDSSPLKKPHFRLHLENASKQNCEQQSPSTEVMLFCLAIVLYELWKYFPGDKNMYEPRLDRFDDGNLNQIRMNIKRQMEKWVQTRNMPETYAEIIEWCLDAPPCTADEMKDSKKLNEMFERVICGLEKVENECSDSAALIERWKRSI